MVVDDRTDEEKAAGRAKVRAWLANLPPNIAEFYQELRRIDPKGQRREQAAVDEGQGRAR